MTVSADLMVVRTDKENGDRELVSWHRAAEVIASSYEQPEGVLRQMSLGHPIDTTFATFQHRDFVEGFERGQPGEDLTKMGRFEKLCIAVEDDARDRGYWDEMLGFRDFSHLERPNDRAAYRIGRVEAKEEKQSELDRDLQPKKSRPTKITDSMRKLMVGVLHHRMPNWGRNTMSEYGGLDGTCSAGRKRGWFKEHEYGFCITRLGRRVAAENGIHFKPPEKDDDATPI